MSSAEIQQSVERYYTGRFHEHGASAQGVDWRDEASQELRFKQLLRVTESRHRFSLIDFGCGYGALVEHLSKVGAEFEYQGYDLSEPMIAFARERFGSESRASFTTLLGDLKPADFVVASGIFNVKLQHSEAAWRDYVLQTIELLNSLSSAGFAFNMLTSYSDPDRMRTDLYYPDPREVFDLCKRQYSRWVALLHDYGLYEFTVVVRK